MFARFLESAIAVIDAGAAKMFLRREARHGAIRVAREFVLTANSSKVGIAVRLLGLRQGREER